MGYRDGFNLQCTGLIDRSTHSCSRQSEIEVNIRSIGQSNVGKNGGAEILWASQPHVKQSDVVQPVDRFIYRRGCMRPLLARYTTLSARSRGANWPTQLAPEITQFKLMAAPLQIFSWGPDRIATCAAGKGGRSGSPFTGSEELNATIKNANAITFDIAIFTAECRNELWLLWMEWVFL